MTEFDPPFLMIPGPVEPYPEAQMSLTSKIMAHYGDEWVKIYFRVIDKLKKIFGTRQQVHIYPGAGTSVVEMGISTVLEPGDNFLVINKGFFIDRFREIAEIHGAKTYQVAPEKYGKRTDLKEIEYAIKAIKPKAVMVVHNETSTGVLEDIGEISSIIPEDTFFFVDAISSYGALELKCDEWNVDLCIGYSSKALGAINGVVPFMVSEKLWDYSDLKRRKPKSFALDLGMWRHYIDLWPMHPYPISISTPLVIALEKAADIVLEEGIKNVEKRHYRISTLVKQEVADMGLKLIPDEDCASPTVTVAELPKDINFVEVIKNIREEYGILISSTWLIKINGIRIGHMGYTARERFVVPTIYALRRSLEKLASK